MEKFLENVRAPDVPDVRKKIHTIEIIIDDKKNLYA